MLRVNVMTSLLNRLKERSWRPDKRKDFYNRSNRTIVLVQEILVDASVDLMPQVEGFFDKMLEDMKSARNPITDVLLPGGGDIPIPDFFRQYCEQNGIGVHAVHEENYRQYADFN